MPRYRSSSNDPIVDFLVLLVMLAFFLIVLVVKLAWHVLGAYIGVYVRYGRPGSSLAIVLWLLLLGCLAVLGGCVVFATVEPSASSSIGVMALCAVLIYLLSTSVVGWTAHRRGSQPERIDRYVQFK